MAFTAKIITVSLQNDEFCVVVDFNDSATAWAATKTYNWPPETTQAQAVSYITADGTSYKANLAKNTALQSKVGFVITI